MFDTTRTIHADDRTIIDSVQLFLLLVFLDVSSTFSVGRKRGRITKITNGRDREPKQKHHLVLSSLAAELARQLQHPEKETLTVSVSVVQFGLMAGGTGSGRANMRLFSLSLSLYSSLPLCFCVLLVKLLLFSKMDKRGKKTNGRVGGELNFLSNINNLLYYQCGL